MSNLEIDNPILKGILAGSRVFAESAVSLFDKIKIKALRGKPDPDILLLICPLWDVNLPALGITYLYSYLKSKMYIPTIFDMNIDLFNRTAKKSYWLEGRKRVCWLEGQFEGLLRQFENQINQYVSSIVSSSIPIIAFSINETNRLFSLEVAKRIKKENGKRVIIFGGVGVNIEEKRKEIFSYPAVDIWVYGEGELTLEAILWMIKERGKVVEPIPGAIVNEDGGLSNFTPRKPIEKLGDIPFPTFENLPLNQYQQKGTMPLLTTRSCRQRCAFCGDCNYLRPFRKRPIGSLIEEINFHIHNNGACSFVLFDLACNNDVEHLNLFCDAMLESGLKIPWASQAIARREMNYDLLLKMKKTGCATLTYGVESGSNEILRRMRKPYTCEIVEQVIRLTKKANIKVQMNIIVGFPGETEQEFNETCEFVKRCSPYISSIGSLNICNTNIDSDLVRNFKEYGIILPENFMKDKMRWIDANGNGVSFRINNGKKLISILNKLSIPIHDTNLNDPHLDNPDWLMGK